MKKSDIYTICLEIATKAHEGQFRMDGVTPYIEHPITVADQFSDIIDKSISILHDVIEDTPVTFEQLRQKFWDVDPDFKFFKEFSEILHGVSILTHSSDETYAEYIMRVSKCSFVKKIKIMDIICNLADTPTEYQKKKYKKAMKIMLKTDDAVWKILPTPQNLTGKKCEPYESYKS